MKKRLLDYLACPYCGGEIRLGPVQEEDGIEIISGELACSTCARVFPINRGIPRFAELGKIDEEQQATAQNFGWSWRRFSHDDERYTEQFLAWIAPVRPDFFAG